MSKPIVAITILATVFTSGCVVEKARKGENFLETANRYWEAMGRSDKKYGLDSNERVRSIEALNYERKRKELDRIRAEQRSARKAQREMEKRKKQEAHERIRPQCKYAIINGMACAYGLIYLLKPIREISYEEAAYLLSGSRLRNIYNGLFGYHIYGCTILHTEEELVDWTSEWVAFFHVPFRTYFFALREDAYCPGQEKSLLLSEQKT